MFFDYAILHQKSLVLDYDVVPLTNLSYLPSPQHNFPSYSSNFNFQILLYTCRIAMPL